MWRRNEGLLEYFKLHILQTYSPKIKKINKEDSSRWIFGTGLLRDAVTTAVIIASIHNDYRRNGNCRSGYLIPNKIMIGMKNKLGIRDDNEDRAILIPFLFIKRFK